MTNKSVIVLAIAVIMLATSILIRELFKESDKEQITAEIGELFILKSSLDEDIAVSQREYAYIRNEISEYKNANNYHVYIFRFELSKSDDKVLFELPVNKTFYNSFDVGTLIADKNLGDWKMKVVGKEIR